jgi:lipid-A-disaccharide synthase
VFAAAADRIAASRPDVHFVTPIAAPGLRQIFDEYLEQQGVRDRFTLVDGSAQAAMSAADVVLQASGTAVLEAALLRKPAVAAYRVAPLSYFLARYVFRLKLAHYTLPNLLTQEPLVPEFMQRDAQAGPIADAVIALLGDPRRRALISERFDRLRRELALDADQRAADAVLRLARP